MKITQEKLKEIIASHGKWLRCENDGEIANLRNANLSGADLSRTDLRNANLCGANLYGADLSNADLHSANLRNANLSGADLSRTDLDCADLSGANLSGASLYGANLCGASLYGADLSNANLCGANLSRTVLNKTYYQIVRVGSRNATTTYCVEDDKVVCGCWNNYKGGTLEEFRKRVESVYDKNGESPNKKYYGQYMAAIEVFEKMAKLAKKEEKE